MAQQTILIHFDSRSDAQKAVDALAQAGVSRGSIRMLPEGETTGYKRTSGSSSYDHEKDEGRFFASLGDMFLPDEDRYAYAEGMSRGGVTLSVRAEEGQIERLSEIAERHGAVDMDERETSWRSEGWTGYAGATGASSSMASTRGASNRDARQDGGRGGDPDRRRGDVGRQAPSPRGPGQAAQLHRGNAGQ